MYLVDFIAEMSAVSLIITRAPLPPPHHYNHGTHTPLKEHYVSVPSGNEIKSICSFSRFARE